MRIRYQITLLILLGLIGGFAVIIPVLAQDTFTPSGTCPAFVNQALAQVGSNCANLNGSSACYGYGSVNAITTGSDTVQFSQPSDRVSLNEIDGLQTFGLSQPANAIGIALMNVHADAVSNNGAAVGNVRYILFGDVEITNAVSSDNMFLLPELAPSFTLNSQAILRLSPGVSAPQAASLPLGTVVVADGITQDNQWLHITASNYVGWVNSSAFATDANFNGLPKVKLGSQYPMQAFNFHTSDAAVADCVGVPSAALILQAPPQVTVDVMANGVPVRFTNTVLLRTTPDNAVEVINLSGDVTFNAGETNQAAFRAASSVAARLGVQGTSLSAHLMSNNELAALNALEGLPGNVLYSGVSLPNVVQPSGIGGPGPIVIPSGTPFTPGGNGNEPPFPLPSLDPGTGGVDLDAPPWDGFGVGGEVCPPFIVFHSDRNGSWELYRTDGNNPDINLSKNPTDTNGSIQPTRSADGQYLAFATNRDDGNWELYITDMDGIRQTRFTYNTGVDINPVWGPGNVIVFESNRDANWELYSFDVATGVTERLTEFPDGADVDAAWSPDGQTLVFSREVNGNYELFTMDLTSSERPRPVTQITNNNVDDIGAKFSNDGTKLLYLERDAVSGVFNLHVLDLTTNEDTTLVSLGADVGLASWAMDDSYITFESNTDGDYDVFAVKVDTGEVKNVSNNTFQDRAPSILCESNTILYQSDAADTERNFDIFSVNPDLNNLNSFLAPLRITSEPSNEIYSLNSPLDEDGSREGRLP